MLFRSESTASSPGAGHYGHYKTVSVCARLPEKHPQHSKTLAEIYAAMLSLPLKHGFSPKRWQYCVDAIIEKIPNKPRIEKLRIIMLYEADFNFLLKLVSNKIKLHTSNSLSKRVTETDISVNDDERTLGS